MTEDIIFEGGFNLQKAYQELDNFLDKASQRLKQFNKSTSSTFTGSTSNNSAEAKKKAKETAERQRVLDQRFNKLTQTMREQESQAEKLVNKGLANIKKALDANVISQTTANSASVRTRNILQSLQKRYDNLLIKVEEHGKATKGDIVTLKRLNREYERVEQKLEDVSRATAKSSIAFRENNTTGQRFFKGLVIGGFALQQFGGLLNIYLTQPLIRAGQEFGRIFLRFDEFRQRLKTVAGLTAEQSDNIFNAVRETARQPNLQLEDTIEFFDKLIVVAEIKNAELLQVLGKGYARVLEGVESSEKRGLIGQLLDVFGSGDIPQGFSKTLVGTPRLNKAIKDILGGELSQENLNKAGLDGFDLIVKAFQKLANEPVADTARNRIANIKDEVVLLADRVGQAYEDRFLVVLAFTENRLIPALDKVITRFEQASPLVQNIVLASVGLLGALAPLTFALGTLSVVGGGLFYLIQVAGGALGALLGNTVLVTTATSSLSSLLASMAGSGGILVRLLSLLNPVTAVIATIVTVVGIVISYSDIVAETIGRLLATLAQLGASLGRLFSSIFNFVSSDGFLALLEGIAVAITALLELPIAVVIASISFTFAGLTAIIDTFATLLQFLADLLNGDVNLAFARLEVNLLKIIIRIQESIPYLREFSDWWSKILTGESFSERLIRAEQNLARLDGTMNTANKTQEEMTELREKDSLEIASAERKAKTLKKTQETLTKAYKEQSDALRENTRELEKNRRARTRAIIARNSQEIVSSYDRDLEDVDLTTNEGVNRGRDIITDQNRVSRNSSIYNAKSQQIENLRNFNLQMAQELRKQAEEIKNDKETSDSLHKVADALETQQEFNNAGYERLRKIFDENTTPSSSIYLYTIYDRIAEKVKAENTAFLTATNGLEFDEANRRRDFEDRVRERAEQLANDKTVDALELMLANLDSMKIEAQRLLDETLDSDTPSTEKIKAIERYYNDLNVLFDGGILSDGTKIEKGINEISLARELVGVKERGEIERIIKRHRDRLHLIKNELGREQFDAVDAIVKDSVKKNREIQDSINELLLDIKETNIQRAELLIEIAGKGGNVEELFGEAINDFGNTDAISLYFDRVEQQNNRLKDIITANEKTLKQVAKLPKGANLINKLFELTGIAGGKLDVPNINSAIELSKQIALIVTQLDNSTLSNEERTGLTEVLAIYEELLARILATKNAIKDENEKIVELEEKYALAKKESRLKEVQTLREIYSLEKQISDEIESRNTFKDLKGIKAFIDFFKGKGDTEKQRRIEELNLERELLKAEFEVAIARLEIEQQITLLKLQQAGLSPEELQKVRDTFELEKENIRKKYELETELLNQKLETVQKSVGSFVQVLFGNLGKVFGRIFNKDEQEENESKQTEPVIDDEAGKTTEKNAKKQLTWLDKLKGGLGKTVGVIQGFGQALIAMEELSVQAIAEAIKAELDALASKALIKSLEYAAIALSALVFGDFGTAKRAGLASAGWLAVAGAAKAGSALLGLATNSDSSNADSRANNENNVSEDEEEQRRIVKQKALTILLQFDIRQDEGIIMKKHIEAIGRNSEITTLTKNGQGGFAYPPQF